MGVDPGCGSRTHTLDSAVRKKLSGRSGPGAGRWRRGLGARPAVCRVVPWRQTAAARGAVAPRGGGVVSTEGEVRFTREGAIWTATLHKPEEENALSRAMLESLADGLADVARAPECAV